MNKQKKTYLSLLISFLIILIFGKLLPASNGLTNEGLWTLGIFIAALIMWTTISISWPCLIVLFFLGLLPSVGYQNAFIGTFGNSTLAFLIFTFALVYPLSQTNFIRRCTIALITNPIAKKSPWRFVIFLFTAITFLGLFISPTVLMVTFMPFLLDIFKVLHIEKGSKVGSMITMGSVFCINLSSGMTAIAHVWPTLAISFYKGATGKEISQFQYMLVGIPLGILIMIGMLLIFRFIYYPKNINNINLRSVEKLKGAVSPADRKEKIVLATMLLTVILWVVPSFIKGILPTVYTTISGWTTAFPPLLGCIILMVINIDGKSILNFNEVTTKGISWSSVLMVGVASELGNILTAKPMGIETWLTNVLSPIAKGLPEMLLVLFFVVWCVIETNFSSSIVTTTIVSSIAISIITSLKGSANGVSLAAIIALIGFGVGISNMTPAGQAGVNPIAIGTGYTSTKDMLIWGGIFAVISIVLITSVGYPLAKAIL
ncbi:SLC13 family permease [Lactobacillus sp. ESL0228]|uniref:SLC13 family permease n=1 Tax=Lactobacillus sp. ESL0228 TaxID=2069352 RepID=UPI000EFD421E|nr:SLC13 family permease [Lactobacillus sp. ESL0228]RMC51891.1 sodium:sulfate symporter [Lactobacillus sp. ESL0228]